MKPFAPKSAVAQLTDHLREEIRSGRIGDRFPGVNQLVRELGVGTQTVIAAVAALENEGVLENLGGRRGRKVVRDGPNGSVRGLKVEILLYEKIDSQEGFVRELLHQLRRAGYSASFSKMSLLELGMKPERVKRYVEKNPADAWVVFAGSQPVLEWFSRQPFPTYALAGNGAGLDIAGLVISKSPAVGELLHRLVKLGHRRICLITREQRRKPQPGVFERQYLSRLAELGIQPGPFNLPDWKNDPQGFQECLAGLFEHTPPSALIFDEPILYFGALPFFARNGIRVPDDVSIVVLQDHPAFPWGDPMVTHLDTNYLLWVPKVVRWLEKIAGGKDDRRKSVVKAKIVEGGSIARVYSTEAS